MAFCVKAFLWAYRANIVRATFEVTQADIVLMNMISPPCFRSEKGTFSPGKHDYFELLRHVPHE